MFISRAFGRNATTVRIRPWSMLCWAVLLVAIGGAMIVRALEVLSSPHPEVADLLGATAVGFVLFAVGVVLARIGGRHIGRAIRTFLS